VPTGVLTEVVTVRVEEPDPLTEVGTNEDVAPDGNPLTDKFTVPEKPFKAPTEAVYETLPPCTTDLDPGDAEMEKSGAVVAAAVIASRPRITLSLLVPVPNVALWAPAATPTLSSNVCPVIPMKLLFVLPLATLSDLVSSRTVYPVPPEHEVSTPIHAANTRSPALDVVTPPI
jgi:hypothetical protein